MLSLAAVAFCLSAVSVLSQGARGARPWGAGLLALACGASATVQFGVLEGVLVTLVLLMTVASVLVLVLAPRPERARRVAWVGALGGVVFGVLGRLGG